MKLRHRRAAGLVSVGTLLLVLLPASGGAPRLEHLSFESTDPASRPVVDPAHTVARVWVETLLDAIRLDRPKPPVHARNLFHLSAAIWDAWAVYDTEAIGYIFTEKHGAPDVRAAREEAISYAALRLLQHRFPGGGIDATDFQPCQPGAETSLTAFVATMTALGYDPDFTSTAGDTPAEVGNRIGQAVIEDGQTDGAFEGLRLCYPDDSGYFEINPVLIFDLPGTTVIDPNRWQALAFDSLVLQNGVLIGTAVQSFVGAAWGDVQSFAIPPIPAGDTPDPVDCGLGAGALSPIFNPGCPPQLGGVGDQEVKDSIVELIRFSSYTDPTDGVEIDISPSVYGNRSLGTDDGTGHGMNPFTGRPYAPNLVKRGDWTRILAEFWADGPDSETPPGHWFKLAHLVTDHPQLGPRRLGGSGPLLDDLEWDVKLGFALGGAMHDAAIAAWGTKQYYDSSRPITLIRHMGGLGQSTDPAAPSYDPDGLPLVAGLIELITEATIAPGGKHEHLSAFCAGGGENTNTGQPCTSDDDCPDDGPFDGFCDSSVDKIAIYAWRGEPGEPLNELGGVGWIRAIDWMPYQASNFVTPPFPGYTSGHSTFSRAGAEVLRNFTGSEFFPGGLGTFTAVQNEYLEFEEGPTETVTLQWATYADAADEAGISRRYGGIHPWYDDYPGRVQGFEIGNAALNRALQFFVQDVGGDGGDDGESDAEQDGESDGESDAEDDEIGDGNGEDDGTDDDDDDDDAGMDGLLHLRGNSQRPIELQHSRRDRRADSR